MMARLHEDHRNLKRLMALLSDEVDRYSPDADEEPDLNLILDIVTYLNDYPRFYHHPLEEKALDYMVEAGLGDTQAIELIRSQHALLEDETEQLARLFETVALDQPVSIDRIRAVLVEYLQQMRRHIEAEDELLFPAMESALDERAWREIAARLPARQDALVTESPDEALQTLREHFNA